MTGNRINLNFQGSSPQRGNVSILHLTSMLSVQGTVAVLIKTNVNVNSVTKALIVDSTIQHATICTRNHHSAQNIITVLELMGHREEFVDYGQPITGGKERLTVCANLMIYVNVTMVGAERNVMKHA